MKLAAKLILVFFVGVLCIVALFSWQTVRRQQAWERVRQQDHATELVDALTPAITKAYREGGVVTIQEAVEVSSQHVRGSQLRWVDKSKSVEPESKTTVRHVSSVTISSNDGSSTYATYVPLVIDGNESGTVEVSQPAQNHDDQMHQSLVASLVSLLGVTALSAIVVFVGGVRMVGKPLSKLIEQVRRIGEGELAQPPVLSSHDELGSLAVAISQMSHRLRDQQETIRHTDRLGTVGTLAAGVAHELGTPLNVVSGRAELIASGKLSAAEIETSARAIKSESVRMTSIIRQLLDSARHARAPLVRIDVIKIVSDTCNLVRSLAKTSGVEITVDHDGQRPIVRGDATQLQQVFTNLLNNAIQAMPDGGVIDVSVAEQAKDNFVCISFTDSGIGIRKEQLRHVFEPFYTTKDVGQGTGLGLSIAYGIVREYGGELKVESEPGRSTTFSVYLPIVVDPDSQSESLTESAT